MEVEITSVKENPLMERREVEATVNHSGEATPSKEDVLTRITADKGLEKDNVDVKNVYGRYGSKQAKAVIHVFEEFEYDEELEEETVEQDDETAVATAEYEDIVSGTITDAKQALNDMEEPDFEAAITAEEQGKNRNTFIEWMKNQA